MGQPRLFTPADLSEGGAVDLDPDAANHLGRVLRARVGDPVTLFNGDGFDYAGTVAALAKGSVRVTLGARMDPGTEAPLAITLGLALSKGDRFDWAVQKATELGVAAIAPLFTTRVDVRIPTERREKRRAHWQQVAVSACEQSGRARIPAVQQPLDLDTWLETADADCKLVLHHRAPAPLASDRPRSVCLLVGPEGGLTQDEVARACAAGFAPLRLGPRVLRTETAPAVALSVLGACWGDLLDR